MPPPAARQRPAAVIPPFTPKRKAPCIDQRLLPERRAVVRFKSGHVLRIDHGLVARVLLAKTVREEFS